MAVDEKNDGATAPVAAAAPAPVAPAAAPAKAQALVAVSAPAQAAAAPAAPAAAPVSPARFPKAAAQEPSAGRFPLSLEHFCTNLSASDNRVELISAFHDEETRAGRVNDTDEVFRARFQAFCSRKV